MQEQKTAEADIMDLTDVQACEIPNIDVKRKVRFSDQNNVQRSTNLNLSVTEEFHDAVKTVEKSKIIEKRSLNDSEERMNQENEINSEKENVSTSNGSKSLKGLGAVQPGLPQVVTVLVVESRSGIVYSDLGPLVDSSLKKLEKKTLVESFYSTVSGLLTQMEATVSDATGGISNTAGERTESGSAGGLLSAIAHVMRYALRGLHGSSFLRTSVKDAGTPHRNQDFTKISTTELTRTRTTNGFSSLGSSFLLRPEKRHREINGDSLGGQNVEKRTINEGMNPLVKRPRGWYKIKGREPIARMKKSVSLESQGLQQKFSSSVESPMTLPSRVHQSTQTD